MIPDPHVPFVVEVDASTTGVGAVLSQQFGEPPHLQPCAYYSKKLSSAEQNYDIRNQELLAIKLAHPFVVISCHKILQYLRDVKWLNLRQARWAMFFYKIPLHYLPSRESKLQGGCPFPTCKHYPSLSQFSLQPSSWALFSGTSTRTSEPPLWLNLSRWEAQKGKCMFPPHNSSPFLAQSTKYPASEHPGS